MTKKQKKELVIGGIIVAAGVAGYYLYTQYQASQAAASTPVTTPVTSSTPATTTPISNIPANTAATTPAPTPTVLPVSATTMAFQIYQVNADNQAGQYLLNFQMGIVNNTGGPVTVSSVTGEPSMDIINPVFINDQWPVPVTGIMGAVSDNTVTTIPADATFTKFYVVKVPVNASTNLYLANLAFSLAQSAGGGGYVFYFTGAAVINGVSVPFTAAYKF